MARAKKTTGLSLEERLEQALVPEFNQPYPVPGNWCWTTVGIIGEVKGGKRLPSGHNLVEYKTNHAYLRVTDFSETDIQLQNIKYITDTTFSKISNYTISKKDIYISIAGTIGRVGIIQDILDGSNLTENAAKITNLKINQKYLLWLLLSTNVQMQMGESTKTTTQAKLALFRIEGISIPIPPLTEQQRIVDRIESLFAKLDEAKEKAQAALDSFETRKAAILHKAFTGELTSKWREENDIGMESWEEVIALNCLLSKPRNGYSPSPVSYPTKVKSLTLSATTSGEFKPEYFKYIDEKIADDSYLWLKTNDILIQRANSLEKVGSSAIYLGSDNEFIYPDLMMKLQVNNTMLPKFLAYQLKTNRVMDYLRNNATGTAGNMPKINQKVVSNIPLYRPTTHEQTEIISILDSFFAKEQKAKELCSVLDKIDIIKKSILARALRGELDTNDPTEESALELLKSIV